MGVDTSASLVYGFEVPTENVEDLASACEELGLDWRELAGLEDDAEMDDLEYDGFDELLSAIAGEFDLVQCCSYMTRYYVIGVEKAKVYGDDGGTLALTKLAMKPPGERRVAKLQRLADALGAGKIGWHLTVMLHV